MDPRTQLARPALARFRRALGLLVVGAFALVSTASGGGTGGPIEGIDEGVNDALQDDEFNPFVCDRCDESPSFPGEGEGEGEGEGPTPCEPYSGPTSDPQRDPNCQAAWDAQCNGIDSTPYCDTYNASGWGSPGNCPYC